MVKGQDLRTGMLRAILFILSFVGFSVPTFAQTCGHAAASFPAWLDTFKSRATESGLSFETVDAAFASVRFDPDIVARDRSQKPYQYSFEKFVSQSAPPETISLGRRKMKTHQTLLTEIESRYGVPGEILVAIWGLESGFGRTLGHHSVFQALATLAYDCRRSKLFVSELLSALKLVDRGDISFSDMKGGWAGEIGQVQFLASNYLRYAVDFDDDGKADLMRSVPDALASTANFLRHNGWRRRAGWSPGLPNFKVLQRWNQSPLYQRTIAYLASKLR